MSESNNDALSQAHFNALTDHFSQLRDALNPQWQTKQVITTDGSLQQNQTLAMGPVAWFLDEENQQAGFLIKEETLFKQGLLLAFEQVEHLSLLAQSTNTQAQISFDPTLTRALKIAHSQESVFAHVEKGGIWVLPIIAFGVFALLISLRKGFQLTRLPNVLPAMAERLSHINTSDTAQVNQLTAQAKGMQHELINIALASPAGQRRDDQLFSALLMQKHKLEYWLGAVAITAAVSPLLGLLGTVSGMIETFKLMTLFGAGDASAVSGGISEALVTTELGLVVAIPALLMHALLSRKVKTYYGALESCAVQLSQTSTTPLAEAA
jgi:biopolymer transport protein ExbB